MTPKSKIEYAAASARATLALHRDSLATAPAMVAEAIASGRVEEGRGALAYELGIRTAQTERLERELQRVLDILTAK
jgi:hypothetical protein